MMKRAKTFAIVPVGLLFCATSALASETTRYLYDARGRVTTVDTRRTNGTGYTADYDVDKSDNRKRYSSAVVKFTGVLSSGASLALGESILTTATTYRFTLQHDGNLVLYAGPSQPLWATFTFNATNAHLDMQTDGNLVLYEGGAVVWQSNTGGHPGAFLGVQDDGNIVVYTPSLQPLWSRF